MTEAERMEERERETETQKMNLCDSEKTKKSSEKQGTEEAGIYRK